jgi:hypothetical protein
MSDTERFEMRVTPAFLDMIDEWRRTFRNPPSRSAAIKQLCEKGVSLTSGIDPEKFKRVTHEAVEHKN